MQIVIYKAFMMNFASFAQIINYSINKGWENMKTKSANKICNPIIVDTSNSIKLEFDYFSFGNSFNLIGK